MSTPVIKCKKEAVKKCRFWAIKNDTLFLLDVEAEGVTDERRQMDGHQK